MDAKLDQLNTAVSDLTTVTANDLTEIARLLTDIKNKPEGTILGTDLDPAITGITQVTQSLSATGDQIKAAADALEGTGSTGTGTQPLMVSLSPTSATVAVGGTQQFSPNVSDNSTPTYSVEPAELGTIDPTGVFVAGAAPGSGSVVATASDGSTASASVSVVAA